ncbi:MAG: hypothetical protein ABIS47_02815 [Acidimicrobiales bacterium]
MARVALACPRCGGPLPPEAERRPTRCPYCRSTVLALPDLVDAARFRRAFDAFDRELEHAGPPGQRVLIGGVPYRLFGECGAGTTSVVRCGRRDRRITEEVVVKLPRHAEAAPRLEHEHQVLIALAASTARGAGHFGRLVPEPVALGQATAASGGPIGQGPALVLRRPSGFVHTLADVAVEHPGGLDPRHGVWLWRRLLEVLGFVHESGFSHGAVTAEHVLVHARDHGARLVGFGSARSTGGTATGASRRLQDLVAAARAVAGVVRSDAAADPFGRLLADWAAGGHEATAGGPVDAYAVHDGVAATARDVYGQPAYVPLALSGWR